MARLMSFAKTVKSFEDGTKDVTRRDGWLFLKPGDVVEGTEASMRNGPGYWCEECARFRPLSRTLPLGSFARYCASCEKDLNFRGEEPRIPRRLGKRVVVSVRRERLGDITPEEVRREGLGDMRPAMFVAVYCYPKDPDPNRVVTRIEFAPRGKDGEP